MLQINHRFFLLLIITSLLIIPLESIAQISTSSGSARQYLEERNEVYFSFEKPGEDVLRQLFNIVSIDDIKDGQVVAYANSGEFKRFLEYGIAYEVLLPPSYVDFDLNMKSWDELKHRDLTESWDFYPTYEAYVELMYQFAEDYPDLVEIINIGPSVLGRDLLFARISPQLDEDRAVPQFMYTSTMHGDETAGFILSLRLIHYLISNYGEDEAITELVNSVDIYICPNENPDGTYRHDNSTVAGATRGNINGVDLNRNYPNPVNDPPNEEQPETTVMINFTNNIDFIMSANMHGGIELVNFPFDSWTSSHNKHADHDWWEFVMYEYVDTVHAHSPAGYMTGMGDGVTHGGDWYVVYGSRQDYFNYYRSCREFTLELSNQKLLNPALLPAHWEYNYRSLLNYIRQSTYGVHGLVYDNESGEPLLAEISIPGYDKDNSEVFSIIPLGNYNRPLLEGEYDLRFIASGYPFVDIADVEVMNYQTTRLNIAFGEGVSNNLAEVDFVVDGMGYIEHFYGNQFFNDGANVFLNALPDEDWEFVQWMINGANYFDPEITHTLDGDTEIVAVFSELPAEPAIALDPHQIDFGIQITGVVHTKHLTIKNAGYALLSVHLELEGDDAFFLEDPVAKHQYDVEPGSEEVVPVYFLPPDEGEYVAQLIVNSNDPNMYLIEIAVTGSAEHEAAIIMLSDQAIDFGDVDVGESSEKEFFVLNTGNLPLMLEDISIEGDVFTIEGEYPVSIDPGEQISLTASFNPFEAGDFEQTVTIISDAMNETETELLLQGRGVDPTGIAVRPHVGARMQVYPNPISENSILSIHLSEAKDVDISMYDLHGQMLNQVYAGELPPGEHSFSLNYVYWQMNIGIALIVTRVGTTVMSERIIRLK